MEHPTLYIVIILILVTILILSILGGGVLVNIVDWLKNVFNFILEFIGGLSKNTGEIINGTSDVVTDTAIFGIELIDGVIHNIGNIFKGQATPVSMDNNHLDIIIQTRNKTSDDIPEPANKENEKWCFVGVNNYGSKTCVKLYPNQSCQSNKIFNDMEDCIK